MFEELKSAWRQAVDNFWQELQGEAPGAARLGGMRNEIAEARSDLSRLEDEVRLARERAREEREAAETARRRARMAEDIGDGETVRVAREYADRHEERAAVLERKARALEAERDLWKRDLAEMEDALRRQESAAGVGPGRYDTLDDEAEREAREFDRLEENDRQRTAEERLEDLKRRMQERQGR